MEDLWVNYLIPIKTYKMSKKTYEISLLSLTQDGILCKNIDVTWEKPSCINIKCEYDTVTKTLKITVPDDCVGECIYVKVECKDNKCTDCPQFEYLKICPCTVPSDCDNCETCEGNMCVSVCDEGEFCSNDLCVECDPEHPCPCNQICVKGKCTCPPGTQEDAKGCCKTCLTTEDDCPPCTICTPNGCEPVDCVIGVCDPLINECVECLKRVDCKKEHECCVDKKCECCDGFVRNLVTGECEPEGCYEDKDCEECEICDGDICIPMDCGPGYICVKDQCEPICDCDETLCSKTEACVNLDSETCYCKECEGDCDTNGECGEGCYCAGNGKCEPKPCKGKCTNGTECGPGCGCDENGDCVPCDSLDCVTTECKDVLGCICTGAGCKDETGCNGECSSYHDCGPGCTCVGGFCEPCIDFSCDNNDCINQPGCECQNDGLCGGDPDRECADIFTVTKIDESCDLEASLIKQDACACSPLALVSEINNVSYIESSHTYKLTFDVSLRKGFAESLSQAKVLPKLGDINNENIADNEKPTSGSINIKTENFFDVFDNNGKKIESNVSHGSVDHIISIANKDTASYSATMTEPGYMNPGATAVQVKTTYTVIIYSDLVFPNGCTFKAGQVMDVITVNVSNKNLLDQIAAGNIALKSNFEKYLVILSLDVRNPLFTVYRSTDNVYDTADIISKIYIPKTSLNEYIYTLYGPMEIPSGKYPLTGEEGGLRSGKYYAFKNDCSCDPFEDLGKLVFCNPTELFYEAKDCNTKVKLLKPFEPCSVNQDLKKFGINDPNSQVKYDFYLNTTKVATFVDSQYGMVVDGQNTTMFTTYDLGGEIIETISLKMNHDDLTNPLCDITIGLSAPQSGDVNYLVDCNNFGDKYKVTIPNVNMSSVEITKGTGSVKLLGLNYILSLTKKQDIELKITYTNHCVIYLSLFEDCCEEFEVNGFTVTKKSEDRDTFLDLSLNILQGFNPFYIEYKLPNGTILGYNTSTSKGGTTTTSVIVDKTFVNTFGAYPSYVRKANETGLYLTEFTNGQYIVSVLDSAGCLKTVTFNVNKVEEPVLIINGYSDFCDGGSTQINIAGDITTANGILNYTENGIVKSLTLNAQGKATISNITISKTFVFTTLIVGGFTYNVNQTVVITKTVNPQAVVSTAKNVICLGDSTILNFTGTPGATVVLSGYSGNIVLNNQGKASITIAPVVTTSYSITTVSLNNCTSPGNSSVTITVNPAVDINLIETVCVSLTSRTMKFDNITSAVDNLGNSLIPVNNIITVNPNLVTSVVITYSNPSCEKTETFTVESCPCDNIGYTVTGDGVICEGVTYFSVPVSITFAQAGNDIRITDNYGTLLYTQSNVGAGLFLLEDIASGLTSGGYLVLDITNHNVPQCKVEGIFIQTTVIHMSEPPVVMYNGPYCINTDMTFSTTLDPDLEYLWRVFNISTSTYYDPVFNTSNVVVVNVPESGDYEIVLYVTHANYGCQTYVRRDFTVEDCCGFSATLSQGNNCMPIVATPINITAPYQLKWYIDGVFSANQGLSYPAAHLPAGTGEAYVELIKNGCTYTSDVFVWEKCDCYCQGNACLQKVSTVQDNNGYGNIIETDILKAGTDLSIVLMNNGAADRFRVYENDVLIVDTGYIGHHGFACAQAKGYPWLDTTDMTAGTNVTADINGEPNDGGFVKPGINVFLGDEYNIGTVGVHFDYTMTLDSKIRIYHNDDLCPNQLSFSAKIICNTN